MNFSSTGRARRALAVLAAGLAVASAACKPEPAAKPAGPAESTVQLGPENVARVERRPVQSGPSLAGALRARREATVRAEVGGQLVEATAEAGRRVKRGQVLARIQDAAAADQLAAARSGSRAAENGLETARRNHARAEAMAKGGAIAARDLDLSAMAVASAEAQLADARSRVASAEQQLSRLRLPAPFGGVVQDRHANAGDIVQPGAPLFTVVDPSSLRLEAFVPADFVGALEVGTAVDFRVTGHGDRSFRGKIEQVSPSVDPATGQVKLFVEIPNVKGALLAGLFARGRIAVERREAPAVPVDAVDLATTPPTVVRVQGGKAERVRVELGLRDEVAEVVEVKGGLAEGDVVLRASARGSVADGGQVRLVEAAARPAG